MLSVQKQRLFTIFFCCLFFTAIRGSVVLIMPFFPILFNALFCLKVNKRKMLLLVGLAVFSSCISLFYRWTDVENALLGFWLFLPIVYLMNARPIFTNHKVINSDIIIHLSAIILIAVDLIGIITYNTHNTLSLIYGVHYEQVHGQAMLNALYMFYYGNKVFSKKWSKIDFVMAIFFLFYFFLCDFGMGKICLMLTIGIYLIIHRKLKYFIILGLVSWGFFYVSHTNIYGTEIRQLSNIQKNEEDARKFVMFKDLYSLFSENPPALIIGVGSGGYNSRATQLLTKDRENVLTKFLGHHTPYWYRRYIYPLWNHTFVSQSNYTDGTRNKPYSSFIAILCEHGAIFTFIFFWVWIKRIFFYLKREKDNMHYAVLLWINIFFLISCITHEWMVCSEFLVFLLFEYILIGGMRAETKKMLKNTIIRL